MPMTMRERRGTRGDAPVEATSGRRAQPEQPLAALGAEHGQRLVTAGLRAPKDLGEARVVAERRQPGVVQQRFRDGVATVNRRA